MAALSLKDQIIQELENLTPEQQAHLLGIARQLQRSPLPPGTSGDLLADEVHRFVFPPGALDEMMQAIKECCEEIDWDGWQ